MPLPEEMGSEDNIDVDEIDFNSILNELSGSDESDTGTDPEDSSAKGSKIDELRKYISTLEKKKSSAPRRQSTPKQDPEMLANFNAMKAELDALKSSMGNVNNVLTSHGDDLVNRNIAGDFEALTEDPDINNEHIKDVVDLEKLMPAVRKMHNESAAKGMYRYPEEIMSKVLFRPLRKALSNSRQLEYRRKVMSGDIDVNDNVPLTPKFESGTTGDARNAAKNIAKRILGG